MKIQYDPDFLKKLKELDVRIHKAFEKRLAIFIKNPLDPQLNNHQLSGEYSGLRSINITSDYRVIYEEIVEEGIETVTYFMLIGTHLELYRSQENP